MALLNEYYNAFNTLLRRRRLMLQHYRVILRGLNIKGCSFHTGINGAGDLCVEIKCAINTKEAGWIFGSRIALKNNAFSVFFDHPGYNNRARFDYGNDVIFTNYHFILGTTYTIKLDKGEFYINEELINKVNQSSFNNNLELYLCGLNLNGVSSAESTDVDFYYAKIWKNDVLVRDYIPSMVSGVYGLYDNISGTFSAFSGGGTVSPIW